MAKQRIQSFPPGTFIPTSQRLMAILQLCLAFSLLLWYITQPFMGEYFTLRSRMLLYEYVKGTSPILKAKTGQESSFEKQSQRFKQLPEAERLVLEKDYQQLSHYTQRPFFKKIADGLRVLIQDIPPFEQAWIFFSITLSFLILLKKEGAKEAAWILPFIVLAYAADNQLTGHTHFSSPDHQLFPSEEMIVQNYLVKPLAASPFEQKKQLEEGWKDYLIDRWSSQSINEAEALDTAEFNFTVARLKLLHAQPRSEWLHTFHETVGPFCILLYLLWNGLFAGIMLKTHLTHKE